MGMFTQYKIQKRTHQGGKISFIIRIRTPWLWGLIHSWGYETDNIFKVIGYSCYEDAFDGVKRLWGKHKEEQGAKVIKTEECWNPSSIEDYLKGKPTKEKTPEYFIFSLDASDDSDGAYYLTDHFRDEAKAKALFNKTKLSFSNMYLVKVLDSEIHI